MTTHIFTSSANVFLSFQNQTEVSRRCLTESGWKAWPEMCSLIHRMTSEQGNILVRLLPPLTPNHISSFSEVGGATARGEVGGVTPAQNCAVKKKSDQHKDGPEWELNANSPDLLTFCTRINIQDLILVNLTRQRHN